MSKAITNKADDHAPNAPVLAGGIGPSMHVQSEPTFARFIALGGAALATIGCVILWLTVIGGRTLALSAGFGGLTLFVGVAGLLLHAVVDKDLQFRLLYLAVAAVVFVVGAALCIIPYPTHFGDMFGGGFVALLAALLFVLAVLRNETDAIRRDYVQLTILGAGGVTALTGLAMRRT